MSGWMQREVIHEGPWWDIKQQSSQPAFHTRRCGAFTAEMSFEHPFSGGTSLRITGDVCLGLFHGIIRLQPAPCISILEIN